MHMHTQAATLCTQVVLKLFPSVAAVLASFDVDCCAFAYDGHQALCTPRAMRAAVTRCNAIDLQRRSALRPGRKRVPEVPRAGAQKGAREDTGVPAHGCASVPGTALRLAHAHAHAHASPRRSRTSRGCSSMPCAASPSQSATRRSTAACNPMCADCNPRCPGCSPRCPGCNPACPGCNPTYAGQPRAARPQPARRCQLRHWHAHVLLGTHWVS